MNEGIMILFYELKVQILFSIYESGTKPTFGKSVSPPSPPSSLWRIFDGKNRMHAAAFSSLPPSCAQGNLILREKKELCRVVHVRMESRRTLVGQLEVWARVCLNKTWLSRIFEHVLSLRRGEIFVGLVGINKRPPDNKRYQGDPHLS